MLPEDRPRSRMVARTRSPKNRLLRWPLLIAISTIVGAALMGLSGFGLFDPVVEKQFHPDTMTCLWLGAWCLGCWLLGPAASLLGAWFSSRAREYLLLRKSGGR